MYFADFDSQRLLDTVIMEHLIREGQIDSAETFARVSVAVVDGLQLISAGIRCRLSFNTHGRL